MKSQLRLLGGRKLKSPPGEATRPTTGKVREALLNIIGEKIENCNWLDLFSGSGVMSCEAIQKGAKRVLAIEQDKKVAKICQSNLISIVSSLNSTPIIDVFCREVISFLKQGSLHWTKALEKDAKFDIVYLDPPYGSSIYYLVLDELVRGGWITDNSIVICEYSSSIKLEKPNLWIEKDRRVYGSSALLFISPPKNYSFDTDSRLLQKGQEG